MERALRRKFTAISCGVVFVVLFTMALVMNVSSYVEIVDKADEIIALMAENDGRFPVTMSQPTAHLNAETPYTTRYFTVRMDQEGNMVSTDTRSVQLVSTEQAIQYGEEIYQGTSTAGFVDRYRYQVIDQEDGSLLIFVDCNQDLSIFYAFLRSSVLICFIALLAVFALMAVLSRKAVGPIVESYRKQQQFITNVTHELKTPLAIIKTNTEVMELESTSSQWSNNIHHQIDRLNELVNHLVTLSKMEEGNPIVKVDFSISDAVSEVVDGFQPVAESGGYTLKYSIGQHLTYCGDEQSIRLLTSILVENALKYSTPHTEIQISLLRQREKTVIQVVNQAEGLTQGRYDMLFERFYRLESSRNSQLGGFGVGLSMAKSIVKSHGGAIRGESPDGQSMKITAVL